MLVTSPATAFATVVTTTGTPATGYRVYHDIEDWGVLPDVEMTYFTMEGRTAFCIEAGGAIRGVSGNYQPGVENNIDVDYAISTITEDNSVQSQAAYLGYYSLDNPTMKDYVFTQMMIWQSMPEWYANGINSATGEYRSYFIDSTIRAEYEVWKAKIKKKIDTWNLYPSLDVFYGKSHSIVAGKTITLTDENGVLEDYNSFTYVQNGVRIEHNKGSNVIKATADKTCDKKVVVMTYNTLKAAGAVKYDSKATANYVYTSDNSQDIGVYGTTDPVPLALSFSVQTLGSLKIIKASEGKLISGITFNVEKTDGTYTATVKTGADGTVTLADIPTGEYEISEVTPSGYVKHDTVTVTVEPVETAIADFENELQKGKIAITKKGSVFSGFTKTSQGIYKPSYTSANLAGAVYDVIAADDFKAADGTILQKKGTVVDTLTTGSNGRDTTNEIYLGTYILKEKVPPTGYVLDETEYTVTLTYAGEEKDFTTVSKTLVDKRQQVNVSLKKAMELDPYGQLTPETVDDVTFGLYADENLYVNGSTTEYIPKDGLLAVLDVKKKGRASYTGNLPAGRYYVKEIATNNKYIVSSEKYTFVAKYDNTGNDAINISINNGNAIENEYIKCSVKVIKKNNETGNLLKGVFFKLYSQAGTEIAEGYTNDKGILEFTGLPIGTYILKEEGTITGYVVDKTEKTIVLTKEKPSSTLTINNALQKGKITLTKQGNVFTGFTQNDQGVYVPTYTKEPLAGAVYEVVAAEDFKGDDGTVLQKQGAVVDTITTGTGGKATTKELYLGKYILKEKMPPTGYVIDTTEHQVTLAYAGQTMALTTATKTVTDSRQQVKISLEKLMEIDSYGQLTPEMVDDVTFGLYAGENLFVDGNTTKYIPKDGLMAVLDVDRQGKASYSGNLPEGNYYVKEIATNDKYLLSGEKHEVNISYDNGGSKLLNISVNNGTAIENEYIKCRIKIVKKNNETGNYLKGVHFKLYDEEGKKIADGYTDEKGVLEFKNLPVGKYTVKEGASIGGYVIDKTEHSINLTKQNSLVTLNLDNKLQKGKITLTKRGQVFTGFTQNDQGIYVPTYTEGNLEGAVYEVIVAEDFKAADGRVLQKKGAVADTLTTGADGKAITKEIYLGKYIVKEKMPPTGYILDTTEHEVELVYAGEQVAVAASTKTVIDDRQQVNISLIKTMEIDPYGQLLPEMVDNVSFGLYTEEDIYTHDGGAFIPADSLMWVLDVDEKGRASYRGNLPEGRYYLKEVVTDPHYILSEEKYPIELRYDKTGKEFIDIVANGGDAIENEYVKCSLNIIKSDEETGVLLEGTGFKLFNEREEEIAQGYTDEKGFLEFDELPVGEYKVREFEASSGYLINQEERHITLTQQQISQDVQVENQIKVGIIGAVMRLGPESIQEMVIVPKTEDITGILFWLMLAGGSFFCIVYVLWILNRRGRIKGKEYKKKEYRKKEKRFVIPVMLAIVLAFTGTFSSITAMAASRITRVYEFVSQTEDFQYTDNQNIVIDEEEYHAVDISYEIIAEIDDVEDVPSIEKKKNKHVEKTKIEEKEKDVESEKVEEKLLPVTSVKVWEGCRQKPQIPESMVVYAEDEEGKKIETRVFLDKVEERESRNKSTFEIDAEFIGDKDCQYYLMGDMRVKVNPEEPTFQGYEEALLNYLHLDSQIYTITGGLWLGDFEQKIETGETVRYARFAGEARDLVDYTAYYKGSIPMWETSDFEAEKTDFEAETTDIEVETAEFKVETAVPESEIIDDKVRKTDIDEETERSKKYLVQATVTYEKDAPSIDYNVVKAVPLFLLIVIIVAAVTIFNLKRKVPAAT